MRPIHRLSSRESGRISKKSRETAGGSGGEFGSSAGVGLGPSGGYASYKKADVVAKKYQVSVVGLYEVWSWPATRE